MLVYMRAEAVTRIFPPWDWHLRCSNKEEETRLWAVYNLGRGVVQLARLDQSFAETHSMFGQFIISDTSN